MSDESRSHFQFERDGVRVEITGEWGFVQRLYREVMCDVDAARTDDSPSEATDHSHDHVVWVIRCGDMMRRIYMADASELQQSILADALSAETVGTLYIDHDAFEDLLPAVAKRQETLWAKLTEAGRRRIAGTET